MRIFGLADRDGSHCGQLTVLHGTGGAVTWSPDGRDKTNARASYQDFLQPREDADPDIPVLKQAELEHAR